MPSHDLAPTTLSVVAPGALAPETERNNLLTLWKNDLQFDFEKEYGKQLKKISGLRQISLTEKVRTELFIKAAGTFKSMADREAKGRISGASVQVNVITSDPTTRA